MTPSAPTASATATSEATASEVEQLEAQALEFMRGAIAARLGRAADAIDAQLSFSELGLDSVSLLELSSKLTERFGVELADFAAYEHATPAALAQHLADVSGASLPPTVREPSARPRSGPTTSQSSLELPRWSSKSGT